MSMFTVLDVSGEARRVVLVDTAGSLHMAHAPKVMPALGIELLGASARRGPAALLDGAGTDVYLVSFEEMRWSRQRAKVLLRS
jgi:hypothetical protein